VADRVDPKTLDANGNNDGRYPCIECGERTMFAVPRGDRPTCGDCLEGRTKYKQQVAQLLKLAEDAVAETEYLRGESKKLIATAEARVATVKDLQTSLAHQKQLADRWQELAEGRVLAGLQAAMVAYEEALGSRALSEDEPHARVLALLEDLEERIIHAGTHGPPATLQEAAQGLGSGTPADPEEGVQWFRQEGPGWALDVKVERLGGAWTWGLAVEVSSGLMLVAREYLMSHKEHP
jgi:hypothetical protein